MCYVPAASDCVSKENCHLTIVRRTITVFDHFLSSKRNCAPDVDETVGQGLFQLEIIYLKRKIVMSLWKILTLHSGLLPYCLPIFISP